MASCLTTFSTHDMKPEDSVFWRTAWGQRNHKTKKVGVPDFGGTWPWQALLALPWVPMPQLPQLLSFFVSFFSLFLVLLQPAAAQAYVASFSLFISLPIFALRSLASVDVACAKVRPASSSKSTKQSDFAGITCGMVRTLSFIADAFVDILVWICLNRLVLLHWYHFTSFCISYRPCFLVLKGASAFKKFQVISHVISNLILHVILRVISWFTLFTRFELSKATSVAVAAIASQASRVSWQKGSFFCSNFGCTCYSLTGLTLFFMLGYVWVDKVVNFVEFCMNFHEFSSVFRCFVSWGHGEGKSGVSQLDPGTAPWTVRPRPSHPERLQNTADFIPFLILFDIPFESFWYTFCSYSHPGYSKSLSSYFLCLDLRCHLWLCRLHRVCRLLQM